MNSRLIWPGLAGGALALAALACAPALSLATAGPTPERIVSLRMRILAPARYAELRMEWQAYADAHPREALGWYQLAKAYMYTQAPCAEAVALAQKAVHLEPRNAEALATLGRLRWATYCPGQPADPDEAVRLLERALALDPALDDPHYLLWTMRLSQGRVEEANSHLRTLLDRGRMPEPLVDFAHNLLVGLEPNAILLTNGDNDTYPIVALQNARGFRADVAVVNLSLLNLEWYRAYLRRAPYAVPVPLLPNAGDPIHSWKQSDQALKGLLESLAGAGWKRPLYAAVTVSGCSDRIANRLSLEGLVYRVLPQAGGEPEIDVGRITRNMDELYRLGSARSLALDWESWSAIRPLMMNYGAIGVQLVTALGGTNDVEGLRRQANWLLELLEFHKRDANDLRVWIKFWDERDPKSPELARWKAKYPD